MSNAFKATLLGTVSISARLAAGHIRFTVADTGVGLSKEVETNLWTAFKQSSRWASGTGLGLYHVHHLALALGGAVGYQARVATVGLDPFWPPRLVRHNSLADTQRVDLIPAPAETPKPLIFFADGSIAVSAAKHPRRQRMLLLGRRAVCAGRDRRRARRHTLWRRRQRRRQLLRRRLAPERLVPRLTHWRGRPHGRATDGRGAAGGG